MLSLIVCLVQLQRQLLHATHVQPIRLRILIIYKSYVIQLLLDSDVSDSDIGQVRILRIRTNHTQKCLHQKWSIYLRIKQLTEIENAKPQQLKNSYSRLNSNFVGYPTKVEENFEFEISTLAKNMLLLRSEILKKGSFRFCGVHSHPTHPARYATANMQYSEISSRTASSNA